MKILSWIIALCGLWEFGDVIAPFVPGFGKVQPFVWNHVIVGFILIIAGAGAALIKNVGAARTLNWIAAVAGGWLIIASLILRAPVFSAGLWNDIIVGIIIVILGVWAALSVSRVAR